MDPLERLEADLDNIDAMDLNVGPELAPPPSPKAPSRNLEAQIEAEVDAILAKISRSGLESLTPDERATLDAARERKLRGEIRPGETPNNPPKH